MKYIILTWKIKIQLGNNWLTELSEHQPQDRLVGIVLGSVQISYKQILYN